MKHRIDETKHETLERMLNKRVLPALEQIVKTIPAGFEKALRQTCKILIGVCQQNYEEEGPANEGQLLLLDSGITRSYYYDDKNSKERTSRISKRNDLIIDIHSFLHGTARLNNVQVLESGRALSISYTNLKTLLDDFKEMHAVSLYLQAERERESAHYQHLLKVPLDERVALYLKDNPGLPSRINNDYIAQLLDIDRSNFSSSHTRYRVKQAEESANVQD
ncbi:CRP-like cAMP-binding protein [Pedobacter sp. AK017]|uniref:Crp/Fnr family transcriptional regulator n=1 Tax=Pedobacter sp. AK017 TaxID=2723073 RepID=UPI00160A0E3B|nr:hypothetical protein [Pedobacter sp. AK017]MBB5438144.1 CRP-like cAMP-binding protein [Pedobacter sp. AK017]